MKIFETASFHLVKPCNMKCKFCYATFEDIRVIYQLPLDEAKDILLKLKRAGLEKITFTGGEPLLYKNIEEIICYASRIGLVTSIISNGSLMAIPFLNRMRPYLEWIGLSVDSLDVVKNEQIGRTAKSTPDYYALVSAINERGYMLKINTVVNRFNQDENMLDFINFANPSRWKIFDTLRVVGQNEKQFETIKPSKGGFKKFVETNAHPQAVVESNEAMTGSYLLIDPVGRLFENSKGEHTYSRPLQSSDVATCLSEIALDYDMFLERGGIYEW